MTDGGDCKIPIVFFLFFLKRGDNKKKALVIIRAFLFYFLISPEKNSKMSKVNQQSVLNL